MRRRARASNQRHRGSTPRRHDGAEPGGAATPSGSLTGWTVLHGAWYGRETNPGATGRAVRMATSAWTGLVSGLLAIGFASTLARDANAGGRWELRAD